jgi:hypothetical protein
MGRWRLPPPAALLAALFLALVPRPAAPASFPPELRFRSLDTPRATIHYHQGLEAMARQAATLAGEILDQHERRYGVRLPHLQIVLADVEDDPNGFASPLPFPLVGLRAAAPTGADDFGANDGWLRLVMTHELAHSVHLEEARGVVAGARRILGRAPFLFPNASTPTWMIEGLATYEETEQTAFGRGRNPDVRMVLRMAALEGDFPSIDQAVGTRDRWPGGNAAYYFGEAFLRDLTRQFGPSVLPTLARVHAGRAIPYLDDWTARKVTGASFTTRWREWKQTAVAGFASDASRIEAAGLTESRALTTRGIRQGGARWSPDGTWIAYTNRNLTRHRAIHLVRADGSEDRRLLRRNDGYTVAWTPDGRSLVFDESDIHHRFSVRSDLRVVEIKSGRVRRLTRGARAREPDVAPDGARVVFVRQLGDRTELAVIGMDGTGQADLTQSELGVQWARPRFSPDGRRIAASRMRPTGEVDLVVVDMDGAGVRGLTADRAKDVEPAWTPDGTHLVFRSDRDGVSNLYAIALDATGMVRLTNLLGGAFTPDVSPDGRSIVFSRYRAAGYDVHVMPFDIASAPPAAPYVDALPPSRPTPAEYAGPDRAYRPWPAMRPRFWAPYLDSGNEVKVGAATGGADPLFRHVYGAALERGFDTGRFGFHGFYQYDRWLPTLLMTYEDQSDVAGDDGLRRSREWNLRATVPLANTLRRSQSVSVAWRRSREVVSGTAGPERFDLGGIETAWALSTVRQFPYSISPAEGIRLRVAYLREAGALGSDVGVGKATADARAYRRLFSDRDTLALRIGGGTTFGAPSFVRSFAVGGFPDGSLFDVVQTNHSVLRGYAQDAFRGRRFAHANVEYRRPLADPQRGFRTIPVFLRPLHASVFADAANAWSEGLDLGDVKCAAGGAVGVDLGAGPGLAFTLSAGVAHGFSDSRAARGYFRTGLAF